MSFFNKIKTLPADSPGIDAYGRIRVSNPETIFDSKQLFHSGALIWDDQEITGSSTTSIFHVNRASTILAVASGTLGTRTRQTKASFNYQPGKSQEIMSTFVLGNSVSGVTKQIGYFDDDNGLFLEDNGTNLGVVVRSSVTGTVVDTRVAQADWNLDVLDGAGASTKLLDMSKAQLLVIDFEWLGTGRVRFGFVFEGLIVYFHQILTANNQTAVYMASPNNPIRASIANDGTGLADSIEVISSTVISEGGQKKVGLQKYISTDGTAVAAAVANTVYALVGIELKANNKCTVDLSKISVLSETNFPLEWILILNPTVAGTPVFSSLGADSCLNVVRGATANTVTGGTALFGGWVSQKDETDIVSFASKNVIQLGTLIDGTRDRIYLCARPRSNNLNIQGSISLLEIQ